MALLDANVAFMSDLAVQFLIFPNGVISGFALSTSGTLVPGLTAGKLIANGVLYAPGSAPTVPAAPASGTNYLFYDALTGFRYQSTADGGSTGDCLIGQVVTSSSAVTAVTNATKLFGLVDVPATGAPGNFSVAHLVGRAPIITDVLMTSDGIIRFQSGIADALNLLLSASDAGLTAKVRVA